MANNPHPEQFDRVGQVRAAQQIRVAGREALALALMQSRNDTLLLFNDIAQEIATLRAPPDWAAGPSPLWLLGHIGWFQEWWIGRNMQRAIGRRADAAHTRLASIEPNADRWWDQAQLGRNTTQGDANAAALIDCPDRVQCQTYLLETLETTLELLDKVQHGAYAGAQDESLYFYRLCLLHEDMQGEALMQLAQQAGLPIAAGQAVLTAPSPILREPLLVPATAWQLGSSSTPGSGFAFDNETPAHRVDVPEFEIDAQPVTWAQFTEFVRDGGYDSEAWWQPAGWRWLQQLAAADGRRAPRYALEIGSGNGAVTALRFGRTSRLAGNQSAMHVSWWEADAWCRWAGRRLPAEVEWEVAAHTAARRGFRWGDVWEWTGTTFGPYQGSSGFEAGPWQAYSQPHFGSCKVLRGASFATRARLQHPKHRAFAVPEADELFCGFRSCAL